MTTALQSQLEAALDTLRDVVAACPEDLWTTTRNNPIAFWRIAHHVLWYTHLYLAPSDPEFVPWPRHLDDHQHLGPIFWDHNRPPALGTPTTRADILEFIEHVRAAIPQGLTCVPLEGKSGFSWLPFTRGELHLYNLRHLQHHAAHLSHRLHSATGQSLPWISHGSTPSLP